MLFLNDLIVTQSDIRNHSALQGMIAYVKEGGFWTAEALLGYSKSHSLRTSPLIQVSRFEDSQTNGPFYIHDGHHRALSTFLAGRSFLREDEYEITDWAYQQYMEVNHANGWYTPFDPRTQVRLPDFGDFKREARDRFLGGEDATQWILENASRYRLNRPNIEGFDPPLFICFNVQEFATSLKLCEPDPESVC